MKAVIITQQYQRVSYRLNIEGRENPDSPDFVLNVWVDIEYEFVGSIGETRDEFMKMVENICAEYNKAWEPEGEVKPAFAYKLGDMKKVARFTREKA